MKLNLGAADRRIEGFISVDIAGDDVDQVVDLSGPWPWETSSVDEVLALDVIEHIVNNPWERMNVGSSFGKLLPLPFTEETPFRCNGKVHFMNELHRVMKPDAIVTIETPNAARGCGYFQDPTHVSPWCLSTFKYFEYGTFAHGRLSKAYGITAAFRLIELVEFETSGEDPREKAWKIRAVLQAVK